MRSRTARVVRTPCDPFVKWVGGKRRLLPQLVPMIPRVAEHARHVEPFAGGGALFFHRRPERALLADVNANLIATYIAVRDEVEAVIDALEWYDARHSVGSVYYDIRDRFNAGAWKSTAERAAMFIYLNRTGFNGLHRVNARGELNVPEGRYESPRIVDARQMYAASIALAGVDIVRQDFEATCAACTTGDFVYFDPPYDPVSSTASFVAYDEGGFDRVAQMVLRDAFRELDRRGCLVMLSNADTRFVRGIYAGYRIETVRAPRAINSDATRRGDVDEVVVCNW